MNKDKNISFLDYLIVVFIVLFFSIVSMYSYVIWPREEKFKSIDRSRMERIADAQFLYKDLTGDYTNNSFRLFALMEAVRDTLYGDSLFIGKRDILLAKKIKRYVINDNIQNQADTFFINGSNAFSFEFAEGVKLYSKFVLNSLELMAPDSIDLSLDSKVQNQILSNLLSHNTSIGKFGSQKTYQIKINEKIFSYLMSDYDEYVNSSVYAITPSDVDSTITTDIDYYQSVVDGRILRTELEVSDATVAVEVPKGFRYKLDTTFTSPIKIEEKYNDTIIAIKLLSFEPTDNFIDNLNGFWDEGEEFVDAFNGYWDEGESFDDVIGNYIYDEGAIFSN